MNSYLEKISINSQDLIANYQKIIASFKELNKKSRKNKIAYATIKRVWEHLYFFLTSKNLKKLDTKGKTVWLIEIEAKVAAFAELMPEISNEEDITNSPKEKFHKVW